MDPAHPDVRITFTPHLLPLDQGELVSCYVSSNGALDDVDLDQLYADAYAAEPFVELAATPPGVRDVRETNICRISVHRDARTGRAIVFAAIDNLWKGAASQAVQNLNLMFGLARGRGNRVSGVFSSRWVERPDHVTELEPTLLPLGFRAAGVAAGLKQPEDLDVGVLFSEAPATVSAARFTTNARVGAPVIASREAELTRLRAVVANSGGSNTGDGQRGLDTARATQVLAAELLGIEASQVGVASTGVIGLGAPARAVAGGRPRRRWPSWATTRTRSPGRS